MAARRAASGPGEPAALEGRAATGRGSRDEGKAIAARGTAGGAGAARGRAHRREIRVLVRRMRAGDAEAREALILANSRLVAKIARRYVSCGSPLADLIQAGHCGLIRAAECYDPATQRAPFSSYAGLWIMKTIHRAVADNYSLVRVPHRLYWLQARYRKAVAELRAASERRACVPSTRPRSPPAWRSRRSG